MPTVQYARWTFSARSRIDEHVPLRTDDCDCCRFTRSRPAWGWLAD